MRARLLDLALIVTGGLLYAASFPPYGCHLGAWLTLVPLLAVAARAGARGAFAAGFLYGMVFFAGTVAWVVEAVATYFEAGLLVALGFSAAICVLFVAVYTGLFAVAARALLAHGRWTALAGIPALWVGAELARARLLTGLPWELLGHSQWQTLPLIQIADLGGVFVVSFLVAATNVGIYLTIQDLTCRRPRRRPVAAALPLVVAALLLAGAGAYGGWRLVVEDVDRPGTGVLVSVVQANQPSRHTWSRTTAQRDLLAYARLSRPVLADVHPDLLVWPEYAVTLYPQTDPQLMPALTSLARVTTGGLVFGAPRTEDAPGAARYYNAAFHLSPEGALQSYDKIRLVPFAEYQPLPTGEAIAGEDGRIFSAGAAPTVLASAAGALGPLICYEAIFPELSRRLVQAGAELLVNLSNDGWLDRAGLGAGAQHLSIAVFRAVETRRHLIRAASSGPSAFVDPLGRVHGRLGAGERGVTTHEVHRRGTLTPYVRYGDRFATLCVLLGGILLGVAVRHGRPA